MIIERFYDEGLAHASYALVSQDQMAVVDPARDPQPYYDFAAKYGARIVAVFETHPHADFVSSHLQIAQETNATIYVSKLLGADYPHQPFDEGQRLTLGELTLTALNTPGHSPDSICILVKDATGADHALFTGDTLFIGDVGRPDLRESAGNLTAKREELARDMYRSTRNVLMQLHDDVLVYPAHGAGSLCGKALSNEAVSTIGKEKRTNYALQPMGEDEFVQVLLQDQPFIPGYFPFNVSINKAGAQTLAPNLARVLRRAELPTEILQGLIVDARPAAVFKAGHLPGAVNIPEGKKFETWLGTLVAPEESFALLASNETEAETLIYKAAKIGYEKFITVASWQAPEGEATSPLIPREKLDADTAAFTIVDVRNYAERATKVPFAGSIHMPLNELRGRLEEIPTGKPVVVHCAAGIRSAMAQSIIQRERPELEVYDLSEAIKQYL